MVITGFQTRLYSVSSSYGLAKPRKFHRQLNYLASYTSYNTKVKSQKSLAKILHSSSHTFERIKQNYGKKIHITNFSATILAAN